MGQKQIFSLKKNVEKYCQRDQACNDHVTKYSRDFNNRTTGGVAAAKYGK